MTINNYLTEKELARRWRLSPATLQRWRRENLGPSYIKMGCIRYSLTSIKEFEESKRRLKSKANKQEQNNLVSNFQGGVYA